MFNVKIAVNFLIILIKTIKESIMITIKNERYKTTHCNVIKKNIMSILINHVNNHDSTKFINSENTI